jgi:poly(hydroxyalkanoate) granule-associated protein
MSGAPVANDIHSGECTMLKKAKADSATTPGGQARDVAEAVLKSSHHIWLAGLGAFAKAQQEGMKVFENLVEQGERLEKKTRQAAADTATAARSAAMSKAKEMQQMAGGTWDKLEQVFEDRVERALSKLGVHTQSDVQKLAERVDELAAAVNKLLKSETAATRKTPAAPKAKASAKAPARKAPAKKAPARKRATPAATPEKPPTE